MIDRLFVIVGAGASFDCTPQSVPHNDEYGPPLTPELFMMGRPERGEPRGGYASILAQYPLAKVAAAELSSEQSAVGLETRLRTLYRDSPYKHDKRIFAGVLPYLQDLLHTVTYSYTAFPQNYEVLVTKLLRLKETTFISLNYDLFLDNALLTFDPLRTGMDWYTRSERNWSLIKLHGSVDWGRRLIAANGLEDFFAPKRNLEC